MKPILFARSLRIGALLAMALGGVPAIRAATVAPSPKQPNVLFIAIDDLNDWGVSALNGHAGVHTPNHAVRTDHWHYIRYANGDEELYDITTDEGQWNSIAYDPKFAAVKAELAAALPRTEAAQQSEVPPPADWRILALPRQKH